MIAAALRSVLFAMAIAVPAVGASAQNAAIMPIEGPPASEGMAAALDELQGGSYLDALDAAERAGPVARDVIEWMRLRDGRGSFEEVLDFLRRRPDWPGLARLRAANEDLLPRPRRPETARAVADFFGKAPPLTGQGVVALVEAFHMLGREGDARAHAALAWVTRSLGPGAERALLDLYPDALVALDEERMEAMFWAGADDAVARAADRQPTTAIAKQARARLAVRNGALDESAAEDGGVAHLKFQRLIARDRREAAVDLLLQRSTSAAGLGDPRAWAAARLDLARRLMLEGEFQRAYEVAASHWLGPGSTFAELEWLAGYLSLRFRDEPRTALLNFTRFGEAVSTPISLGRAGYWTGRAYEALGEADLAQDAYSEGAAYQTSFYGLLAAEKAGVPLDPSLTGGESFPPFHQASFRQSSVLEAALLLQAVGERDLAEHFFTHLAEGLDRQGVGTLGDLVLSLGEPHLAVRIAKQAAQRGITVPKAYYPLVDLGVADMPVAPELALSIARRESEFDPGVASGVGARGLMQLMPATAREVADRLDLPYSPVRLFSDPSYNAMLGTEYLAELNGRFGGNAILVAAGYNAGPGRPLRWIRERGDPRSDEIEMVDWIEMIPFDETRNYVMRVAESLPVYRARLSGETGAVTLMREIGGATD